MQDLNRVQLIGHLGHDPEVKYTTTGTARTTFSVATRARWKDAAGQVQEATEWSRCARHVEGASRPFAARVKMNAPPLRSKAPLQHSPPVLPVGSLGKAWLLSFLTRGANGGSPCKT